MKKLQNVFKRILDLTRFGSSIKFAVALIVDKHGKSEIEIGSRMIVFENGSIEGALGGGDFESAVIKECVRAINKGSSLNFTYDGCEVFIEVFKKADTVVIFGGGHIGLKLSKILDVLEMPYIVVDDRAGFAADKRFPNAAMIKLSLYSEALEKTPVDINSYCVIVTHGHRGDKEVLKGLLKTSAPYIGMIGSRNKVKTILKELEEEGVDTVDGRLHSPIGLNIGSDSPAEIAVSIAAEIIKVRKKH